jgi:hypothetical protein
MMCARKGRHAKETKAVIKNHIMGNQRLVRLTKDTSRQRAQSVVHKTCIFRKIPKF